MSMAWGSISDSPRKRKFAQKFRGRCRTCGSRHVRCSQERPVCATCRQSGRQCTYSPEPTSTSKSVNTLKIVNWDPHKRGRLGRNPSPVDYHTEDGARSMEYFQNVVCSKLGGSFQDHFWGRIACQVACSVTPVRKAILALSLQWEQSASRQDRAVQGGCAAAALKHYSDAVSETRALLEKGGGGLSTREALICNLLFICFESLQQHYESALGQIASGIYLFQNWQSNRTTTLTAEDPDEVTFHLTSMFRRLVTQAVLFIDTHHVNRRMFQQGLIRAPPPAPDTFHTVEEARDCFIGVLGTLIQQSVTDRSAAFDDLETSTRHARPLFRIDPQILGRYTCAFKAFKMQYSDQLSREQLQALAIVEMMYVAASILQRAGAQQSEGAYDQYQSEFEDVIRLGRSVLDDPSFQSAKKDGRSFDTEFIPSLYLVAGRCRDPVTRREALRLLRTVPGQEGIWNGNMLAAVAEHMMTREEAGLETIESARDIPVSRRLTLTNSLIESSSRTITAHFWRPNLQSMLCQRIRY